jgi:hypothetical protein
MDRGAEYVTSGDSEYVGVAATNVYVALATVLGPSPVPAAIALIVVVVESEMGPVYFFDSFVGVEPFVV